MADKYDLFMIMFGLIWIPLVGMWFQLVAIKKELKKNYKTMLVSALLTRQSKANIV